MLWLIRKAMFDNTLLSWGLFNGYYNKNNFLSIQLLVIVAMTCADPEFFIREGPTLTSFFFFFFFLADGLSKYHNQRANIGTPAKRHLNGVSLGCR